MKLNNRNRILSFISIMLIVVSIIITLFYYVAISYNRCIKNEENMRRVEFIEKLNYLIDNIETEKLYSALYLAKKDKKYFNIIKRYRDIVNLNIENIISFLNQNSNISQYRDSIKDIFKHLNDTRIKVDRLNSEYREILFENYFNRVTKPLIKLIETLSKNNSIENSNRLYYFIELNRLKENLNREKIFISYILNKNIKMSDKDLLIWDKLLDSDIVPNFYTRLNSVILIDKLNKIINTENFSNTIDNLRAKIFMDSIGGRYKISIDNWLKNVNDRVNRVKSAEKLLLNRTKNQIENSLSNSKDNTAKLMFISLSMLILLFALIYLFKNSIKNNRLLINTLKDIEVDLDEEQKKEIRRVLEKNDTIEIYNFLANAIKEPSRAKDYFLANMSHEIRTPLNGIIGFTNILKETELKDDQREFLNIIEESSNNLINIVNDILDFSKVSSGKVEFENIPFNLMEKFEATVDSYSAKASQKNINLELFIDPTLPVEVIGDSTKISQVLINLLSNAIKFTEKGGNISVKIEKISETDNIVTIKFSVKDSGIGIPAKYQNKIFDAFSQADASTSRKFGGTGLGLSISSKFVSLMGGKLDVKSQENSGATFFFTLNMPKSKRIKEREKPNLGHLKAIYIILEDNRVDVNLKKYLKYMGIELKGYSYKKILGDRVKTDIIFIDHQYIKDEKIIETISKIDTKSILLTTAEIESCNCNIKNNFIKVIYKPINYSKILRAVELANSNTSTSLLKERISRVDDKGINRAFENINALIVEDNIINQKLIKKILNNFGINVTIASNGLEALNLYKSNSYNIIFMDIQMPIMCGIEATKKILEYEKKSNQKHTPIVALTANVITGDKERYLASGMDRYLKKPIDINELTAILEEYFPIVNIRNSIPLDNKNSKQIASKIILYKETELNAKIYSAVLKNLGYIVDVYSSKNEFLKNIDSSYKFALFDLAPFKKLDSDDFIIKLIKDNQIIPIAFIDNSDTISSCETLKESGNINEIYKKLKKCS